jgi:hypothetical protein
MPLVFFHQNYLEQLLVDPDGSDHADLQSAELEAISAIRELAAQCLRDGTEFKLWSIRLCDADGNTLSEVFVHDALAGIFPPGVIPIAG